MTKLNLIGIAAAILLLAGCDKLQTASSSDASCSSSTAVSLMSEMMTTAAEEAVRTENQNLSEDKRIDLSKTRALANETKFKLQDILTTKSDPNSTKKFCEATLEMQFLSSTLENAEKARKLGQQKPIKSWAEDAGFKVDLNKFAKKISYSVQPTDDGKKVYVQLENIKPLETLTGSVVIWASILSWLEPKVALNVATTSVAAPVQAQVNQGSQSSSSTPEATIPEDALLKSSRAYAEAEREINVIWNTLSKESKAAQLDGQRAFNNEKETTCAREALAAGAGVAFEIARNNCWIRFYQTRIPELKKVLAQG